MFWSFDFIGSAIIDFSDMKVFPAYSHAFVIFVRNASFQNQFISS